MTSLVELSASSSSYRADIQKLADADVLQSLAHHGMVEDSETGMHLSLSRLCCNIHRGCT